MSRVVISVVYIEYVHRFLSDQGCSYISVVACHHDRRAWLSGEWHQPLESASSIFWPGCSAGHDNCGCLWCLKTGLGAIWSGATQGKNSSWAGWQRYAADVCSSHQPRRTRRMSSLDLVMSSVKTSMIVLSWLFIGGTIPTCMLYLWKRTSMRLAMRMCSLSWSLFRRVFGLLLRLHYLLIHSIFRSSVCIVFRSRLGNVPVFAPCVAWAVTITKC